MKKVVSLMLIAFLFAGVAVSPTYAAKKDPAKKSYKVAVKYIDEGAYNSALRIFYSLLESRQSNANLNYYVGVCYYMTASDKSISIPYLQKAAKSVTRKYKNSLSTLKSPIYVHYYLGMAFQNSGQYDDAIEQFNYFKKLIDPKNKKMKFWVGETDLQIVYCKNEKVKAKAIAGRNARNETTNTVQIDTVYITQGGSASEINQGKLLDSIHYLHDQVELYKKQFLMAQEEVEIVKSDNKSLSESGNTQVSTTSSPKPKNIYRDYNGWFTVQVGAGHNLDMSHFAALPNVKKCQGSDGMFRYTVGEFESYDEASRYKSEVIDLGFTGAWVAPIDENRTNCQ